MTRRLFRIGRQRWEFKNGKYQAVLLEKHVLKEIVTRLWMQAKIKVWRINQPVGGLTPQNVPGIPDLVGWIPAAPKAGRATPLPLYIEVKRPGGVRRPAQELWIADARADGCAAFFADSWDCCVRELKNFGVDLSVGGRADGVQQ